MRITLTPLALLGLALLGGCAAAQSSSAAPPIEPDCSFRSASTCWTVAGRFPPQRPKPAPPKADEIRDPSPTAVASKADSARAAHAPKTHIDRYYLEAQGTTILTQNAMPVKDYAPVTELQGVVQYSGRMPEPSPVLTIQVHVADTTER